MTTETETQMLTWQIPVVTQPWEKSFDSMYVELLGTQTRIVQGKKYKTRVIEAGDGEPLILLHGAGGSAESWFCNVMNLSKDFHVYAIDALYHGFSSKEPADVADRTAQQVDHLLDFMDAEGIDKANIEGESMGSHITFRTAYEHPDRCLKIVLNTGQQVNFKRKFAPNLKGPDSLRILSQAALKHPNRRTIRARMEWLMTTPDRVDEELVSLRLKFWSIPELQKALEGIGPGLGQPRRFEEEECQNIKVPTLVFWTEFNPSGGPDIGEYFASLIPGAKYYLMKDAAHWPQYEHPEEHDRVITDFIKGRL